MFSSFLIKLLEMPNNAIILAQIKEYFGNLIDKKAVGIRPASIGAELINTPQIIVE